MASTNYDDGTWTQDKVKVFLQKHPLFLQHDMQIHKIDKGTSFENLVRGARLLDYYNGDSNTSEPDPIDYDMFNVNKQLKVMCRNVGVPYNGNNKQERPKAELVASLSKWDRNNRPRIAAFATHVDPRPSKKNSNAAKAPSQTAQAQTQATGGKSANSAKTTKRKTSSFKDNKHSKRQKRAKVDETDDEFDMEDELMSSDDEVIQKFTRISRMASLADTDKQVDTNATSAATGQESVANSKQDIVTGRTRGKANAGRVDAIRSKYPDLRKLKKRLRSVERSKMETGSDLTRATAANTDMEQVPNLEDHDNPPGAGCNASPMVLSRQKSNTGVSRSVIRSMGMSKTYAEVSRTQSPDNSNREDESEPDALTEESGVKQTAEDEGVVDTQEIPSRKRKLGALFARLRRGNKTVRVRMEPEIPPPNPLPLNKLGSWRQEERFYDEAKRGERKLRLWLGPGTSPPRSPKLGEEERKLEKW
ncbi:hypothetical protein TW65_03497 [Stemphylium lycopersici]|uniref:Uncharacterized protein n=1 Tax=Stemphylium lycopersici TaxID=183478 RepID=A0A364NGS4_STELY|nr:hypothetical protein TW65_03497 [Stemphylium lycopersici]RAR16447.1 hypothetical protein DDE83_000012 [Stemphylium lycopersici]